MEAILRGLSIYVFVFVLIRLSGKRTLSDITPFDMVLMIIIGEATQQALLGDDFSVTNALLIITTLILTDVMVSLWKRSRPRVQRWLDGTPVVIVENGRPIRWLMEKSRVDDSDVLMAARELQGLTSFDQIRYAVLEPNGKISIIPKPGAGG